MNLNDLWQNAWNFYQNKEFQSALKLLYQIDREQDDATVCFVIAQCLWQQGNYSVAINYFYKAYDLDKNQVQYSLALIKALISLDKKNKAKKVVAAALSLFGNHQELILYQVLFEGNTVDEINMNKLIDIFNDNQATQNIINLCLASKLFKKNKHENISQLVYSSHKKTAIYECYDRIYRSSKSLKLFNFPKDLLKYALKKSSGCGHIIEAGVYFGQSINMIAKSMSNQSIIGFDSFEGLPEDWNDKEAFGSYSTKGQLPKVKKNVKLIKGWFKDTIPEFINSNPAPIRFLHIDCDIYSSTKDILNALSASIGVGTIILFDDFFGYNGYENHEWKALNEFVNEFKFNIEFLGFCPLGRELAVKVLA